MGLVSCEPLRSHLRFRAASPSSFVHYFIDNDAKEREIAVVRGRKQLLSSIHIIVEDKE